MENLTDQNLSVRGQPGCQDAKTPRRQDCGLVDIVSSSSASFSAFYFHTPIMLVYQMFAAIGNLTCSRC